MKDDLPLISIIIPAYNVEKYIKRCLDSVLNQTYYNFEVIIIDDGSIDNTHIICEEYANKDKRIKVFHQENAGLSSARNKGLDLFSGEYISFVDSDDYIHPMFLEALFDTLKESGSDISMCYHHKSFSENNKLCKKKYDDFSYIEMSGVDAALKYIDEDSYVYICPCNKLYDKKLFDVLRFPEGKISEDCFLLYRIFLLANKVSVIRNELYFYYMNRNSIMHVRTDIGDFNYEAYKLFYKDMSEVVSKEKIKDIKLPMLFLLIDFYVEDYWRACLKKNKNRMKYSVEKYEEIKKDIVIEGGLLKFKYKLFEFNKCIYFVSRTLLEEYLKLKTDFGDRKFMRQ